MITIGTLIKKHDWPDPAQPEQTGYLNTGSRGVFLSYVKVIRIIDSIYSKIVMKTTHNIVMLLSKHKKVSYILCNEYCKRR
ncbi:hypothetical protein B1222_14705 [Paenibacillus larvae subsp. pulvifaciens]|nr:hypothetical protein B1222_14705 [Paenibacillus larvae subsp. pulvifaciens]AQZ47376.1 hypothetical protein B5S25_13050 [Paenibacillus larvae subsp. pulvifaciens]MBH0344671.1 hypothetical protein [Paenibacillus larvae]